MGVRQHRNDWNNEKQLEYLEFGTVYCFRDLLGLPEVKKLWISPLPQSNLQELAQAARKEICTTGNHGVAE